MVGDKTRTQGALRKFLGNFLKANPDKVGEVETLIATVPDVSAQLTREVVINSIVGAITMALGLTLLALCTAAIPFLVTTKELPEWFRLLALVYCLFETLTLFPLLPSAGTAGLIRSLYAWFVFLRPYRRKNKLGALWLLLLLVNSDGGAVALAVLPIFLHQDMKQLKYYLSWEANYRLSHARWLPKPIKGRIANIGK